MKYFSIPLAALLLSTLLTACGGGGGGAAAPAPVAATPAPAPAPAPVPAPAPAPKYPIPAGLWTAPAGAAPASGNYVVLQSDAGDYIGGGRTYTYADTNSLITLSSTGLGLTLNVKGNENWDGRFLLPNGAANLQAGYFADLTRTPFADAAIGGVEWSGQGRACNKLTGWVAIDRITVNAGVVSAVDLRFEQHCEGMPSALRGQIHWDKDNAANIQPVAPAAIPAGAWQPAAGVTPASGNYLYLESRFGDYIGGGRTYGYTPADAVFQVSASGARLQVSVAGNEDWNGDFQGMQGMTRLSVGYYGDLQRYPFHNPVLGGMSWAGESRGCGNLSGWFVVDKVSYSGSSLTAIDLRFEQYCDGSQAPLRGKLHWSAGEATQATGPLPAPAGLWSPGPSFAAPAGNYVYLVSDQEDYIGQGRTELLRQETTPLVVETNLTAALRIQVGGWSGNFVGMNSLSQLQPGYYSDLQRFPFHNPAKGGMDWDGNGRGCNTLKGWFVVDHVSYALGQLTAIDLRFEQHCEGWPAALRGAIHWAK